MIKLIRKDFNLLLRKKIWAYILPFLPLISIVLFRDSKFNWRIAQHLFLILAIESMMSWDFEENRDSQGLILSLPVRSRDLVLSKYLVVPFIVIINIGLVLVYMGLLKTIGMEINSLITLKELIGVSFTLLIILSFCLPWYFVISRGVAVIISYMLIFFTYNMFPSIADYTKGFSSSFYSSHGGLLAIMLGVLIYCLSCLFSIKVFQNTDI